MSRKNVAAEYSPDWYWRLRLRRRRQSSKRREKGHREGDRHLKAQPDKTWQTSLTQPEDYRFFFLFGRASGFFSDFFSSDLSRRSCVESVPFSCVWNLRENFESS
jgi:hypothetical protein